MLVYATAHAQRLRPLLGFALLNWCPGYGSAVPIFSTMNKSELLDILIIVNDDEFKKMLPRVKRTIKYNNPHTHHPRPMNSSKASSAILDSFMSPRSSKSEPLESTPLPRSILSPKRAHNNQKLITRSSSRIDKSTRRRVKFADESGKSTLCDYSIIESISPRGNAKSHPTRNSKDQMQIKKGDLNQSSVKRSILFKRLMQSAPKIFNQVIREKELILRSEYPSTSPVICSRVIVNECSFVHRHAHETIEHLKKCHPTKMNAFPLRVVNFPKSIASS